MTPSSLLDLTSTPSTLIEEQGTAGVEFQAGARSVRVVFHKDGDVGGHIRIAEGARVLADRPLATSVQRQDGPLRPN